MLQCCTVDDIKKCLVENEQKVPAHALEYLARVNDTLQGDDIYMYGRTASSGNESMKNANKQPCERYGVNAVVATMILKLAAMQYHIKMAVAWQEPRPSILTRKGKEKCDECFQNIHLRNY
jgi:hypothetical protein